MSNEIEMAGVKSAEEWSVELLAASENQGGIDSEQCLIPKVAEIQRDAYRAGEQAGMTEAAEILEDHLGKPFGTAHKAILTARDAKKFHPCWNPMIDKKL